VPQEYGYRRRGRLRSTILVWLNPAESRVFVFLGCDPLPISSQQSAFSSQSKLVTLCLTSKSIHHRGHEGTQREIQNVGVEWGGLGEISSPPGRDGE